MSKIKLKKIGSNQTEMIQGNKTVLYSYETPVIVQTNWGPDGQLPKIYITSERFSPTTSRHVNKYVKDLPLKWERINVSQEELEGMI